MIASGRTGKFWAQAIFYAADISNIQYRSELVQSEEIQDCPKFLRRKIISWTIAAAEMNSASAEERATVGWRLDRHEIAAPLSMNTKPEVDLRESGQPAQSESR